MNPLEKLCLDEADELAVLAEAFIKQFPEDNKLKLLGPLTLSVAKYKTNRNLLEVVTQACKLPMPQQEIGPESHPSEVKSND